MEIRDKGFSKSKIFHWSKKGSIAILDQVLFNGAHFLFNVLLARWLEPAQYGAFAVVYSIFLFLCALHMAILVEPMMVFGAGKYRDKFREYLGVLIRKHFIITISASLVLMAFSIFLSSFYPKEMQPTLLALSIALPFILLLWLLRRAFYVYLKPDWSAIGGMIYFILLLVFVTVLKLTHRLSPATFFLTMGGSSLLISLLFIYHLKPQWLPLLKSDLIAIHRDHLSYGRWALGTNLLTWGTNNAYFVILPAWIGLEGVAVLRALMNLSTPIVQTNSALSFLLLPIFSRHRRENIEKMNGMVKVFLSLFITAAAVYSLGLIFFGKNLMKLFYGNKYFEFSGLVPLVALLPLGTGMAVVLENALRAIEKPDKVFWSYLVSAVVAIAGGILLAIIFGLKGVLWGWIASYLIACSMMASFYKHFINFQRKQKARV